jgi:alpha-L-rhamnosidase
LSSAILGALFWPLLVAPGCGTTSGSTSAGAPIDAATPAAQTGPSPVNGDADSPARSTDAGSSPAGTDGSMAPPGSPDAGAALAPTGLLCELLNHPELSLLTDATPEFGWIVNSARPNEHQTAFRVLVASSAQALDNDTADEWDSGKTVSTASINVTYAGQPLAAGATYFWKVQTWDSADSASPWSVSQKFVMAPALGPYATPTAPLEQTPAAPAQLVAVGPGHFFADFGAASFGWVELTLNAPASGATIEVDLGEKASGQSVDPNPGGTIRFAKVQLALQQGLHTYRVATPKDATNTSGPAVLLPASIGVVMPFRYVEVVNSPVTLTGDMMRQIAVHYPFDLTASSFRSSNDALNQVWNLARYSVMATTFDGIYVDGDRERTPYEADAYIQQLGHYGADREFALARYSHEYLLAHPTWPTEWKQHSVMMAWTDWMYTGNTESLAQAYSVLTTQKTLEQYAGADGLLNTHGLSDIVDWPAGERDGFVLTDVNTVVNAFWCHNLQQMADIADALGKSSEATRYRGLAAQAVQAFNAELSDATTGLYVDGVGSTHSSLHANMFPLAFGLVPADRKAGVVAFVKSRGMACSVYGAQYLLEALYQAGEPDAAVALITANTDRSWMNMIQVGSTITLEAWDLKYKPNLDWNHAWGAAPANIAPRFVLGVQPLAPGFAQASIRPQPGSLSHIEGTVPTIRGAIGVVVDRTAQGVVLAVDLPANMTANVAIPPSGGVACTPSLDGQAAQVVARDGSSFIDGVGSGHHEIRCP